MTRGRGAPAPARALGLTGAVETALMLAVLVRGPVVDPGPAMPELGVTEQDARDLATFQETLR